MFTEALFTSAKMRKQPNVQNQMIDREDVVHVRARTHTHTHTQEYYLAVKKNELLSFAATCMDLEGIMLNEVRQRKINIG